MLSFIVRKAEASRDFRELSEIEMATIAGGADMMGDCPDGSPEKMLSSMKCTSKGCSACTSDDPSCI